MINGGKGWKKKRYFVNVERCYRDNNEMGLLDFIDFLLHLRDRLCFDFDFFFFYRNLTYVVVIGIRVYEVFVLFF